jgi:uncharacterized protein (TIGR03067 family)
MQFIRRAICLILFILSCAARAHCAEGAATVENERARLEGTWEVVKCERRGTQSESAAGIRYVFADDTLQLLRPSGLPGPRMRYDLKVDADPKQIDIAFPPAEPGQPHGETVKAIYRVDGDQLLLCESINAARAHPTKFATAARGDTVLFTLKRLSDQEAKTTRREEPNLLFATTAEAEAYQRTALVTSRATYGKYDVDFRLDPSHRRKAQDRDWHDLLVVPDIRSLTLRGCGGVGDAQMGYVAKLLPVEKLDLRCTDVGDAGIARLTILHNLEHLDVSFTPITDVGLARLAGLKRLRTVVIKGTTVSAQGAQKLRGAGPQLKLDSGRQYTRAQQQSAAALGRLGFDLDDGMEGGAEVCQVTFPIHIRLPAGEGTEGVSQWPPLSGCDEVCDPSVVRKLLADLPPPIAIDGRRPNTVARNASENDAILLCLRDARGLVRLRLRPGLVTDARLGELQRHKALKHLDLSHAWCITDASLAHIRACPGLEQLNVQGTRCTAKALASLVGAGHLKELAVNAHQLDRDLAARCAAKGVKLNSR